LDKNKKPENRKQPIKPLRVLFAGFSFVALLAGTNTYVSMTLDSHIYGVFGVVAVVFATLIALVVFGVAAKKGIVKQVLKFVLIIGTIGIIGINALLLSPSYFTPHKTTTISNRYFPGALDTSIRMQKYLTGKTLYVDSAVPYFDWSDERLSPIHISNIASVKSSVSALLPLEEPYGQLSEQDTNFLIAQTGAYEMVDWERFREINTYFFYDVLESDQVIAVWGVPMSLFFISPETLEQMKENAK